MRRPVILRSRGRTTIHASAEWMAGKRTTYVSRPGRPLNTIFCPGVPDRLAEAESATGWVSRHAHPQRRRQPRPALTSRVSRQLHGVAYDDEATNLVPARVGGDRRCRSTARRSRCEASGDHRHGGSDTKYRTSSHDHVVSPKQAGDNSPWLSVRRRVFAAERPARYVRAAM